MAQHGMPSFPLTVGVEADYKGTEVIVKIQDTKCNSAEQFPIGKQMPF